MLSIVLNWETVGKNANFGQRPLRCNGNTSAYHMEKKEKNIMDFSEPFL